jgi:hypothetical protein
MMGETLQMFSMNFSAADIEGSSPGSFSSKKADTLSWNCCTSSGFTREGVWRGQCFFFVILLSTGRGRPPEEIE